MGLALALMGLAAVGEAAVREEEIDGVIYTICEASPENVVVASRSEEGLPLTTLAAAAERLRGWGTLEFLTNGGIFEPGLKPTGLLIVEGREESPLNLAEGKGNFFLKPNAVFAVRRNRAEVTEAGQFALAPREDITGAIQSGPALLLGGEIHPALVKESASTAVRSGVGVRPDGTVVLAITSTETARLPNLWQLAHAFRHLGCQEALYLDGVISRAWIKGKPIGGDGRFASMIGVLAETGSEQGGR
jgi:uncharacterized protein YigE (DUF2233 family)